MKRHLEHRLEDEAGGIRTPGELENLLERFANEIVFTPLRTVRVETPDVDLRQLFEDLAQAGEY